MGILEIKNRINLNNGLKIRNFIFTVIFIAIGFLFIVPFIWMVMMSFKTPMEMMQAPEMIFPKTINLTNYFLVLEPHVKFYLAYVNSIKITLTNVLGGVMTSALAGYAFGRLKFKGRDTLFLMYLATLMIPPQVTLIPRYILFDWFGLIDNHLSLILPGVFSVIGTFMLRQYFAQIPFELSESAAIDGASEYRTFAQIILPLAKPAMMSIIILNFSWHWNDYENALIFLRRRELLTLPLSLDVFAEESGTRLELISTAAVMTSVPVIAVFLIAQKYFIQGLTAGAIKG